MCTVITLHDRFNEHAIAGVVIQGSFNEPNYRNGKNSRIDAFYYDIVLPILRTPAGCLTVFHPVGKKTQWGYPW